MNKAQLLPPGVNPTGDRGVYSVASKTRLNLNHRVCVEMLHCECEAATKGIYFKMQQADGKRWDNFCPHLKRAIAAHGVLCAVALSGNKLN